MCRKTRRVTISLLTSLIVLIALRGIPLAMARSSSTSQPVTAAFTYQGYLEEDGDPVAGTCDMQFSLYDVAVDGELVGGPLTKPAVGVVGGYFTVELDFGASPFTGEARWLSIAVRCPAGAGSYMLLEPRQALTAVPYAQYAVRAAWSGLQEIPADLADGDDDTLGDLICTEGQVAQWVGGVWVCRSTNAPPVAILQVDPPGYLIAGESATLSLALSYDPKGGSLTYAFDPTGQTPGLPGAYASSATVTATYDVAGDFLAAGWVRDSSSAYARGQALVSVWRFRTLTVDSDGWAGSDPSLAVVGGRPAIAYYDYAYANEDLKYVRAQDTAGAGWGAPLVLDSTGRVGQYASLAVVDGRPAVAYYDGNYGDLKYVRAQDAFGDTWGAPLTLDSAGEVGRYASLAVVDGRPAVAYYDQTNGVLKYVRALDAAGATWGAPLTVDSVGDVGAYASLAVVDGRPAVAYYDATNYDVKYVRAQDTAGSSWGVPLAADSTGNVGQYASLAVVDGRPAVAYYDWANNDLKYVRAQDAAGTGWGTPLTLDSAGVVGRYASLAVVDGRPAVAYYDYTSGGLKCVRAQDAAGAGWGAPLTLDNAGVGGGSGQYAVSLVVVGGYPAVAYHDWANRDLRYAYLSQP
jgi:hypothetical protein